MVDTKKEDSLGAEGTDILGHPICNYVQYINIFQIKNGSILRRLIFQ